MHSKTCTYVKSYDGQRRWMYFLTEYDELSKKYNTIWDKVSADVKKEFLKAKIKSHVDEVIDFYDKEILKVDSNRTCLAVISLDSFLKKDEIIMYKSC